MVKPGEEMKHMFPLWELHTLGNELIIDVPYCYFSRIQVQELVAEFVEWLAETAEAPKP